MYNYHVITHEIGAVVHIYVKGCDSRKLITFAPICFSCLEILD